MERKIEKRDKTIYSGQKVNQKSISTNHGPGSRRNVFTGAY
jgi:hypothetical protein